MQHKGQRGREGTHNTPGRTDVQDVNARHAVVLIVNVIAVLVTLHRTSRECAGSRTVAVVECFSIRQHDVRATVATTGDVLETWMTPAPAEMNDHSPSVQLTSLYRHTGSQLRHPVHVGSDFIDDLRHRVSQWLMLMLPDCHDASEETQLTIAEGVQPLT
ncbi:hypothetical protein C0Q70_01356 [Pomacea canaliculata]|uniref:Uncharacterized protein n=1 Tax=Pomacea canaliculata TaxID=400727 RepID=A0A2T7PZ87_POMCA|nr:hypothetical protein C0Q70_01356 [Pomacea canaliculata]